MAVVGLLVAVPVTIAVRGDGEADPPARSSSTTPELGAVELDRDLGVKLRLPEDWKRKRKHGAVAFRSPDRTVAIAISSPGPASDAETIQRQAIGVAEEQYRKARVVHRLANPRLANRPAAAAVLSARRPGEGEIRLLIATVRGKRRAYLIEVLAAGPAGLTEAQALLNSLTLKR